MLDLGQEQLCFSLGCLRAGKGADRERSRRRIDEGSDVVVDARDAG